MRYRIGLVGLVLAIVVAVIYVDLRSPVPENAHGNAAGSAALIPASQRPNAPDFTGIDGWLNSKPLSLAKLRGKVVLIDFWTFSCINCVRTLPHLSALYKAYGSHGLVIVGVHSPEFDFEKNYANVAAAVRRLHVNWPVAVDSEMATWNAWSNNVWPAEYLLDKQGRLAYTNLGEGDYDTTAGAVQALLSVPAKTITASAIPTDDSGSTTPEIYVGSDRGAGYGLANGEDYSGNGSARTYPQAQPENADHVLLTGTWTNHGDRMTAGAGAHIRLRWHGSSIYVVAGSAAGSVTANVTMDGAAVPESQRGSALSSGGSLTVNRNDLYAIADNIDPGSHLIDITAPAGFEIYTFTFG